MVERRRVANSWRQAEQPLESSNIDEGIYSGKLMLESKVQASAICGLEVKPVSAYARLNWAAAKIQASSSPLLLNNGEHEQFLKEFEGRNNLRLKTALLKLCIGRVWCWVCCVT